MMQNFRGTVCKWTNEVLEPKGKKKCSIQEFNGYLGLELGMSIVKYNDIRKYISVTLLMMTLFGLVGLCQTNSFANLLQLQFQLLYQLRMRTLVLPRHALGPRPTSLVNWINMQYVFMLLFYTSMCTCHPCFITEQVTKTGAQLLL
jgi:hypothetical protein